MDKEEEWARVIVRSIERRGYPCDVDVLNILDRERPAAGQPGSSSESFTGARVVGTPAFLKPSNRVEAMQRGVEGVTACVLWARRDPSNQVISFGEVTDCTSKEAVTRAELRDWAIHVLLVIGSRPSCEWDRAQERPATGTQDPSRVDLEDSLRDPSPISTGITFSVVA